MIASRKHDPKPALAKKPSKFNLGGLIKKKMTWKKSIDSLSSSLEEIQLDYGHPTETRCFHVDRATFNSPSPDEHLYSDGYPNFTHEQPVRPDSNSRDTSIHLFVAPQDQYTACHTECISLQNSEMTSAITCDVNDQESLGNSNSPCYSLPQTDEDGYIPYEACLEESVADYRAGGYHPVKIGDIYTSDLSRYKVIHKLGWGHFSTVWLCVSLITGDYVAMKIVKLGSNYSDAARDEINILKILQGQDEDDVGYHNLERLKTNIVNLLDNFLICGPNGKHLVMVFELMGENLLHLVYNLRARRLVHDSVDFSAALFPMKMMKLIMKQILLSVQYMHQKGVVHTDLKPENILLAYHGKMPHPSGLNHQGPAKFQILPSNPLKVHFDRLENIQLNVKIADLGNATHSHLHFTNNIQTRQYRAPEIILKYKCWGALADVWSIGCLAFELLTGDYLFEPKDGASFSKDEDHLAQIIELIGQFPSEDYLLKCELLSAYFKDSRNMRNITSLKFWPLKNVLVEKYKFNPDNDDVNLLCDFISKCLKFNLEERYDCGSLLDHPWLRDSAKYDKQECEALPNHNLEVVGFTCEE